MSISGTNEATQSVPFGTPVDTGDANAAGSAGTAARSDHVHKGVVAADAWSSYTPTLTQSGAVTKTVTRAKYVQLGKMVTVSLDLTVTGTGTASNAVIVGLPVTAASASDNQIGSGIVFDASAGLLYQGAVVLASTTTIAMYGPATSPVGYLGTQQFTAALASGDRITGTIIYEAA